METEVTKALEAAGVTFEVRKHSEPVFTCETAAAERGVRVAQIVKCMVGRSPEGQLFAMLIPGDRLLKLKRRGAPVTLFVGGEVIRAVIFDVNVDPSRNGGQTRTVSFEFFQVGAIDWLD